MTEGRLVYDSLAAGRRLGARSLGGRDRTNVIAFCGYSVDLTIQRDADTRVFVFGQVVHQRTGGPVGGARVCVGSEEAVTDDDGQFSFVTRCPCGKQPLRVEAGRRLLACAIPPGDEVADS
mgnify:CR=1 FL=1